MSTYNLNGKVALVTGAARGIGFETAKVLYQRGAHVAIVDLDANAATRAASSIGTRAIGYGADVTDAPAIEQVIAQIVAQHGGLDIIVANAGIAPKWSSVASTEPSAF